MLGLGLKANIFDLGLEAHGLGMALALPPEALS